MGSIVVRVDVLMVLLLLLCGGRGGDIEYVVSVGIVVGRAGLGGSLV